MIQVVVKVVKTSRFFVEQKVPVDIPQIDSGRGVYYDVHNDELAWGKSTGMRDSHAKELRAKFKDETKPISSFLERRGDEVWLISEVTERS